MTIPAKQTRNTTTGTENATPSFSRFVNDVERDNMMLTIQFTDGDPSITLGLSSCVAGPPFGGVLGCSKSTNILCDFPVCINGDGAVTAECRWPPPHQNIPRAVRLSGRLLELRSIYPGIVCGDCRSRYREDSSLVENAATGRALWT